MKTRIDGIVQEAGLLGRPFTGLSGRPHLRRATGFTLTELLIVIAIVAILIAIIFPVFATVEENARQSSSMSNMRDIGTKLEQFRLDHHYYPDVLFGYVYAQYSMDKAGDAAALDHASGLPYSDPAVLFPGLYPEYISNVHEFTDPNNPHVFKDTTAAQTNIVCTGTSADSDAGCFVKANSVVPGTLVPALHVLETSPTTILPGDKFYEADAYDSSPQINSNGQVIDAAPFVPRYQTSWTSVGQVPQNATIAKPPDMAYPENYPLQLRWRFPSADTYVTSTTWHAGSNVVLVLFQDGSVHKATIGEFETWDGGKDPSSIQAVNGVSSANFWEIGGTINNQRRVQLP